MESYKCQVCGFTSPVPGTHCDQPMIKQEEAAPTPTMQPMQETTTPAIPAPAPTPEKAPEGNPPAEPQ